MALLGSVVPISDILEIVQAKVSTVALMSNFAITDTANHDITTNAAISMVNATISGGVKLLYVNNTLNQAVTVTLMPGIDGVSNPSTTGTGVSVAAGTAQWIDSTAYAQLANAYPFFGVRVACAVAPASGNVTVTAVMRSL